VQRIAQLAEPLVDQDARGVSLVAAQETVNRRVMAGGDLVVDPDVFSIATLRPRGAVEKRIGDALERGDDNDHRIVIRRIQDDTAGVPDAVWCRDRRSAELENPQAAQIERAQQILALT